MLQEVGLECWKTDDGRTAVAERPQARIGTEDEPVGRRLVEHRDHESRQATEILLGARLAGAVGEAVFRVQENEVDIRGEIQLEAAELAHAEHDERHFVAGVVTHYAETRRELLFGNPNGNVQGSVGQVAQRPERFVEVGKPEDFAPQHVQQEAIAKTA